MKTKIIWKQGKPFCLTCGLEIKKSAMDYDPYVFCRCRAWNTKEFSELVSLLNKEESKPVVKVAGQVSLF